MHSSIAKAFAATGHASEAISSYREAIKLTNSRILQAQCFFSIGEAEFRRGAHERAREETRNAFKLLGEKLPRTTIGYLFGILRSNLIFFLVPDRVLRFWSRNQTLELETLGGFHRAQIWTNAQTFSNLSNYFYHTSRGCVLAKHGLDHIVKSECYQVQAYGFRAAGLTWLARSVFGLARKSAEHESIAHASGIYHAYLMVWHWVNGEYQQQEYHASLGLPLLKRNNVPEFDAVHHFSWHMFSMRGNPVKLLEHARKELEIGEGNGDRIVRAFGLYGLAEGLSLQGDAEQGLQLAEDALRELEASNAWTSTIAKIQKSRVLLQIGDYLAAEQLSEQAIRETTTLRFIDLTSAAYPLYVESSLGALWAQVGKGKRLPRGVSRMALMARFCGSLFPNVRPHACRVSGRLAAAKGQAKKACKYFDRAIALTAQMGAHYEHARALIDKSILDYPEANVDRQKGLALLESLGCVLPDAEVEYLGLDRAAHYARAAESRVRQEAELEAGK
jgi:tetratricopeptide (TPR) repeat protein